jgi:uncharacterized protein (UPF0548 family)
MKTFEKRSVNHPFYGWCCSSEFPDSPSEYFVVNKWSQELGRGEAVFKQASEIIRSFQMTNSLKWIEVHCQKLHNGGTGTDTDDLKEGKPLCTLACCLGIWVLNPCRIISAKFDEKVLDNRATEIAFTTLSGHLLAGEERFTVLMKTDGLVRLDMYSFSRPANILGLIGLPYVRWIQKQFFREQGRIMTYLINNNNNNN